MKDAIRARFADAVDTLSDLDALLEREAGRLQPILLARALVEIDGIAAQLARLRQGLADSRSDPSAGKGSRNRLEAG